MKARLNSMQGTPMQRSDKRKYFRAVLLSLLFLFSGTVVSATHNRAGEITYRQISDLTFEFTITTFTYTLSAADRDELVVEWGDNTSSRAPRVSLEFLPNFYKRNIYRITHTFAGPGVYEVVVQDPNRNFGVKNIPNSVNVVFSIKSTLIVNPGLGLNSTPILLNPPYDKAALGHVFIHNPGAYDVDGDSLSYKLTVCTREDGRPIENFTLPPATDSLYIDPLSGDFVWNTPADTGIYNVAIDIEEWRNGIKIGNVVRDMQIEVYTTDNNPPLNDPLGDFCVEAGDTVILDVRATDEDGDVIVQSATGGPLTLTVNPAVFDELSSVPGEVQSRFTWITSYEHVRHQPYTVLIKSEDQNADLKLVDINNFSVKVLGPSPQLVSATPSNQSVRLRWKRYSSELIQGYAIYRKLGPTTFVPDSCTDGVPESLGFVKVGMVNSTFDTSFLDTGEGLGLEQGYEYTYRITAVFANGDESKVSNELSAILISGTPVLTHVSVEETDDVNGEIFLAWAKPELLDTITGADGPFVLLIYRSPGLWGEAYELIDSIETVDLLDTTYLDAGLNTRDGGLTYKVELYNNTPGNRFLINAADEASSVFLSAEPGDEKLHLRFEKSVPWIVERYDIFRYNESSMLFDSIGSSVDPVFTDTNLLNGETYCYKVRAIGTYNDVSLPSGFANFSQKGCFVPVDNEPPCKPDLNVSSNCDSLFNQLVWGFEDAGCFEDVNGYQIFYKRTREDEYTRVDSITNPLIMSYKHYPPGEIVSGCYRINAFDENGNESPYSMEICVDSCNFYEIPNVFTPNNDRKNDRLRAKTTPLVERIDMKIYSRTGVLVHETNNPLIDWDGTYRGKIVAPGIYYYHCEIFERRVSGIVQFHLSGFVHVITEKGVTVDDIEY